MTVYEGEEVRIYEEDFFGPFQTGEFQRIKGQLFLYLCLGTKLLRIAV
jgi:hypothetical protein